MKVLKKILLVCLSILCLVGCDYTSKNVAKNELKDLSVHSYLGGSLQFVYVENSGGMLSVGSKFSEKARIVIYKCFVTLMLVLLFAYTIFKKGLSKWTTIAFVFILSGGIGNLVDRFTNEGKVIDFIIMCMFNYHTGIFNIADVYIIVGVMLIVISTAFNNYYSARNAM
jgi:signal peptidase II